MDIANYVDKGRRLFVVIHVYNPSVVSDPFFFGISHTASQVTMPPINKRYRIVASRNMAYQSDKGSAEEAEEDSSADESNTTQETRRKRRRTEPVIITGKRKRRMVRDTGTSEKERQSVATSRGEQRLGHHISSTITANTTSDGRYGCQKHGFPSSNGRVSCSV